MIRRMKPRARLSRALLVACLCCAALALSGAGTGLGAGDKTKATCTSVRQVKVTLPLDALNFAALYVARSNGYFAKRCIAVDSIQTSGGGPDIAAVIAGRAPFNFAGNSNLLNAVAADQPVIGVVLNLNRVAFDIFIKPSVARELGITSGMSLDAKLAAMGKKKGRLTWGISRPGAFSDGIAQYYIRKAGLSIGSDVRIIPVGTGASALAAMNAGNLDIHGDSAPVMEQAIITGIGESFIRPSQEDAVFRDFAMNSLIARRDFVQKNPVLTRSMVAAILEANKWILNHSPSQIAKLLANYFPSIDPNALVLASRGIKPLHSSSGCFTRTGWKNINDVFFAAGTLKARVDFNRATTNAYLPNRRACTG